MNIQYQYKIFSWGFAALPFFILLFLLVLNWKKRVSRRIGDAALVKELTHSHSPFLFLTKFILLALAFGLGLLAAMHPRRPGAADKNNRRGIDVVIALDVSKSMLAVDLQPNRLERARQLISRLMDKMPDDRIGLVLFAGKAYLQMPLTTDHGAARLFVAAASPDAIPQQGTVLSDAMEMSARAFNTKERRFKSVILVSDGEDHDTRAGKVAEEMAAQGVMINTVGIGSAEGSPIIDPATNEYKKDLSGNTVISKLDEHLLKTIAQKTNGVYVRMENSDETINALFKQLSQIEKRATGDTSMLNFTSFYKWPVLAMLLFLLLELFIPEKKKA